MFFNKRKRQQMKKPGVMISILTIALLLIFALRNGYAQISQASRTINVAASSQANTWNILNKLSEKDDELAKVPISVGQKEFIYFENRISILPYYTEYDCDNRNGIWDDSLGVCKSVTSKRLTEKEMVIGLKLLNTETGKVSVIPISTKINVDGVRVIAPNGYKIETVERPNGIRWNLWNTRYRVISPEDTVVIKNLWPREETEMISSVVKGKIVKKPRKVIRGFPYIPHSEFFELEENKNILVKEGKGYLKDIIADAFDTLKARGIDIDTKVLLPEFFERLPLLEQGDFTEFQLDPQKTVEHVLIILGANRENAWLHTCNRSDACGWVQFTPHTYKNVRDGNPEAKLNVDFREGAGDHLNSIMAAILLHKINLDALVKKFGNKIVYDPELEKYLAASYNGAPKWVNNSLNATVSKAFAGWITALSPSRKDSKGGLRKETRDFTTKLDYLIKNNLP